MNTTLLGDKFENLVFQFFKEEIESGRLYIGKEFCSIFQKKGYYSRDRDSDIIFDVTIEVRLPGAEQYSMLIVIECKNYSSPITVDNVEEFYSKLQQVAPGNGKGIMATSAPLQKGALNYSRSKGLGHLRYFAGTSFNWELNRSPSTNNSISLGDYQIYKALISEDYESENFDYYFSGPSIYTNSLWDFVEDLLPDDIGIVKNRKDKKYNLVPILFKSDMEHHSTELLREAGYTRGKVILNDIYSLERKRSGLLISRNFDKPPGKKYVNALGRIIFRLPEIQIFNGTEQSIERERFTIAHEISHLILGHGNYMSSEIFEDFDNISNPYSNAISDIARMEYQANYMASCILMPEHQFSNSFFRLAKKLGLRDKGFGILFVDEQPHHIMNLRTITNNLKREYQVSVGAVMIRLSGLDFLNDTRTLNRASLFKIFRSDVIKAHKQRI